VRAGFTLVEVVTVLVILGLGLAVAAPAFRSALPEHGSNAAAAEVAGVLRAASRTARDQARAVTVVLDSASPRYWLRGAQDTMSADTFAFAPDVRMELRAARQPITFQPDGRASRAAFIIRDEHRGLRIDVDPWTGNVAIER
jgi:type II secretion system protein H